MIRVESEETQDNVCEALAIGQEQAEEIAFVPSALSQSPRPFYWCDNRCSEKAVIVLADCVCGGWREETPAQSIFVNSATKSRWCNKASRGKNRGNGKP